MILCNTACNAWSVGALCDLRIQRAKAQRIKESLRGTWQAEHLFALRQALQSWEHYQRQVAECDRQVEGLLRQTDDGSQPPALTPHLRPRKRPGVNAPDIANLRELATLLRFKVRVQLRARNWPLIKRSLGRCAKSPQRPGGGGLRHWVSSPQ